MENRRIAQPRAAVPHAFGYCAAVFAAMLAGLPAGCKPAAPVNNVPPIGYHLSSPDELRQVRKVAFVSLYGGADGDTIPGELTQELFQSIQGRRLFQMELIDKTDTAVAGLDPALHQSMDLDQMSRLRANLGCDAVLIGTVLDFQAYPRMQLSLRLRLIDIRQGKLLWGVDQVWDTSAKSVENRIEAYYRKKQADQFEPLDWRMALVSPKSFEKFVAYEVAGTLPNDAGMEPPVRPKIDVKEILDQ